MAKQTSRLRTSKAALATPAARTAAARVSAARERSVGLPVPVGAPGLSWGGTATPDATGAIGAPGNLNVFGFLSGEDYNPDLDGFAMFANYNKMRLGDAQVNATLLMLKLPLKGATWVVKPADEDDPQDQAIADFVQANLLDDDSLARSWQAVLDNAMLKFDFGCAGAEVIWGLGQSEDVGTRLSRLAHVVQLGRGVELDAIEEAQGPLYDRITDLAPRLPRTFYRWVEDPKTGRLDYLQQFAPKNGQYGYWNIPANRLALHVRAREGNNYYGRAVLRSAYPHWWWKQQLYRIGMVGADREFGGIPIAKLTADYKSNTAPLDKIESTLKGIRSHDRAYAVQPFGVEYAWLTSSGTGDRMHGLVTLIEHHNLMIARNILQSFAAQGEQRHGSLGAASITAEVYFDALEGEAKEIASELKQAAIKPLCDRNFTMTGRKYPTLECTDISSEDFAPFAVLAEAFAKLADKRIITPDDGLEAFFREIADAPPLPDDLTEQDRTPAPSQPTATPTVPVPAVPASPKAPKVAAATRKPYVEAGRAFGREPTMLERRVLDLHGIPTALDTAKTALAGQLADIRRTQLTTTAALLAKKDARPTTSFTDLRKRHLPKPPAADYTKAIRASQTEMFDYGRQQVRSELKKQGADVPTTLAGDKAGAGVRTATSSLVSSAQVTGDRQATHWQNRILDRAIQLRRNGVQGDDLRDAIVKDLQDEIDSGALRDAGSEVHEAFGLGRSTEAQALQDLIASITYSAILDTSTCESCADLDGTEWDDLADAVDPPNPDCDGRDSCRCVLIFTSAEEAK